MIKSFNCKKSKDCVIINLDNFIFSKSPVPLYVASYEGIYKITNSDELWKKIDKIIRAFTPSLWSLDIMIISGIVLAIVEVFTPIGKLLSHTTFNQLFLTLFVIILVATIVLAIIIILNKRIVESTTLVGELIAPWDEILFIEAKKRDKNSETEDWYIHTLSNNVIVIQKIKNPAKLRHYISQYCTII